METIFIYQRLKVDTTTAPFVDSVNIDMVLHYVVILFNVY